jgi:alkylation response protein AidB-like acyl-CoA dehydrogenase
MNFTPTETQIELRDLVDRIIGDHAAVDRVRAVERGGEGIDRDLWRALAGAGILRAFGEADGGVDVVDAALVCEAHGRHVAPVPLWPTLAALLVLRDTPLPGVLDGDELVTVALAPDPNAPANTMGKLSVPVAPLARWALVPVTQPEPALHLVDLAGPRVAVEPVVTTDRGVAGHVRLDGAPCVRVGDGAAVERLLAVATVLVCATHVGVCAEAVRRTADYIGTREQFGRPLAAFQGPVLRIADAHIDTEAMRVTTLQAAWRLQTGRPAAEAVSTAKWWAAEAGHRVVHTAQHLHGGIGADVDYPIHRYFLWGKQLTDTLGGASAHAAELGRLLAARSARSATSARSVA